MAVIQRSRSLTPYYSNIVHAHASDLAVAEDLQKCIFKFIAKAQSKKKENKNENEQKNVDNNNNICNVLLHFFHK